MTSRAWAFISAAFAFYLLIDNANALCDNFLYTDSTAFRLHDFRIIFHTTETNLTGDVYLSLWKFDPYNENHLTEEYVQYFEDEVSLGAFDWAWQDGGKYKVRMIRSSTGKILAEASNNITMIVFEEPSVQILDLVIKYSMLIPIAILVALSGLFSGLNLGLLGLDKVGLEIVIDAGSKRQRRYAKAIYPLRKNGNFLLCTLLLGNVMVNAALSILSAEIFTGAVGFVASSALIVVFGEIIPQSMCARHGLAIGYYTRFLVYLFMVLMFPIAWPISLILDRLLGHEIGTIYSRTELKRLIHVHAMEEYGDLTRAETNMLTGAIDLSSKIAKQVMTPISKAFMLDVDATLDMDLMTEILQRGHSRIPIFEGERQNIVGMLFVKDLALLNPEAKLPIRSIMSYYGRQIHKTYDDTTLFDLLTQFKTGNYHFSLVQVVRDDGDGDPYYEIVGICTLEDVIEALIQENIEEEYDEYVSQEKPKRPEAEKLIDYAQIRTNIVHLSSNNLTPQQHASIFAFLAQNVPVFKKLNEAILTELLTETADVSEAKPGDVLYVRGTPTKSFKLILQGKVEIKSGTEGFVCDGGPFTYLGVGALTDKRFVADFMCVATTHCQYLEITHDMYVDAIKGSKYKEFLKKLKKDGKEVSDGDILLVESGISGSEGDSEGGHLPGSGASSRKSSTSSRR